MVMGMMVMRVRVMRVRGIGVVKASRVLLVANLCEALLMGAIDWL